MAEEQVEFKYRAEYSKSSRASCKSCKKTIEKDVLRLAVLVQSTHFDGKVPHWYHYMCFFTKQRPTDVGDIENFESLKWEDQQKVKTKIEENKSGPPATGKGASKRTKKEAASQNAKDYSIEYSKSSRAMCRGCEIKIAKGEVRISKKDYESAEAKRYGGLDRWHHVECFCKLRNSLEFHESGESLPGFKQLSKEDQDTVKKALPKEKASVKDEVDGEPDVKKVKTEIKEEKSTNGIMEKQNKKLHKYRDIVKDMKKNEINRLLEHNKQHGDCLDSKIDHVADCMTFGALKKCEACQGQFVFKSGVGYECKGNLTEWTQCLKLETNPKRTAFKVPEDIKEAYPSLEKYKCVIDERKITFRNVSTNAPSTSMEDETDSGPKVERFAPLRSLSFYVIGKLKKNREDLKRHIVKLGGTLTSSYNPETLTAVISNEDEVEKLGDKMEKAKEAGIHVIPESFFEECTKGGDMSELITKMSLVPWGSNASSRILLSKLNSAAKKSGKSIYTKSGPSKVTLKLKDGLAVDPDSGLEDIASVYIDKKLGPYTVILSKTNIQKSENSFYKLQLLVQDNSSALKKKYFLFRSWGRIGTAIGDNKTDKFNNLDAAKKEFHFHYQEKTGNAFENKDNFEKRPGCYNPVDVSYGESDDAKLSLKSDIPSKLHESVQQLVSLLFDVEIMKKVMLEFELDLEKMPLGKLSKKQIMTALSVLSELQKKDGDIKPKVVIDATNRFYTLIPHSFGVDNPPKLDNKEIIQSKLEMLESLLEMETAYSLLKETGGEGDDEVHPLDKHYIKLNTNIDVIDKGSDEYVLIDTYIQNTHAETHRTYKLEILDLFKIKRQGEEKRFKPFKKLHNRMLLWHGSRLTNFAGILSQGLRIAPPEAPVTGYMFGKGIYFADMVSKSANYCMTSRGNNVGLLLLCEVALGDMYEKTHSEYVEKLPSGKHSTKGIGITTPDPEKSVKLEDGVEVPSGKGIKIMDYGKTSLLYNEYIVYDPAQVKARYLLKVKFDYKY